MTYSSNALTLKTEDGATYSFSIVGAAQEYKNGIEPGNWIHVTYTGNINGADTSGVKVVKITDDDANVKEAQSKVTIKDVSEKVWATAVVNVRDSYSTNANVLGTLQVNDEVTRTGTCDNGWSRIDYNGNAAYIYAQYLTTTAPAAPTTPAAPVSNPQPAQPAQQTQPAQPTQSTGTTDSGETSNTGDTGDTNDTPAPTQQTVTGFVVSLGDGTLVIDSAGTDYSFNTVNAEHSYANGILVGNEVTVTYVGDLADSANATVYSVVDSATNTNNQSKITGTIQSASMNGLALVTDDNAVLAISTDGATVNCANGILLGERITVTLDLDQTVDSSNMFFASQIDDAQ
ncbi:MAG: SH3 domain-containing protein [Hespellia sp.]|nr:SH3 domain-containing protein [Hespellia sp.]